MTFQYTIDLSRYTPNEVANMLVEGVITREEFEQWRLNSKSTVKVQFGQVTTAAEDQPMIPKFE